MRAIWAFITTFVIVVGVLVVGFDLVRHGMERSAWLEFDSKLEDLQTLVNRMATESSPAREMIELRVPEGAAVSFEDDRILIGKPNGNETLDVKVSVDGPSLNPGRWELTLTRTENGVKIQPRSP